MILITEQMLEAIMKCLQKMMIVLVILWAGSCSTGHRLQKHNKAVWVDDIGNIYDENMNLIDSSHNIFNTYEKMK